MTPKEFKNAWASFGWKECGWYWWPLAVFLVLLSIGACFLGFHHWVNDWHEGLRCMDCGKRWHK